MKKILTKKILIRKIFGAVLFLIVVASPFTIRAQVVVDMSNSAIVNEPKPSDLNFQLVSCNPQLIKDGPNKGQLSNDCNYAQLIYTFQRIVNFAIYLVSPIILGMIIFMGFKYMTAHGDVNMVADAKKMFTPILIGLFFVFAAWIIVHTILDKLLVDNLGTATNPLTKQQLIGPNN